MKIIVIVGILILLIVTTGFFFIRGIGDVRTAVLPPQKGIEKIGQQGDFPLKLPSGFKVGVFAKGVEGARDLQLSPEGVMLLSLTGSGKVVALPDRNNDGQTDEVKEVLTGLDRPHGLAFAQGKLFAAEETRVVRYSWDESNLKAALDKELFRLPAGGNHFTRSLAINEENQLFVSLGSTCNVCFEKDEKLAAVVVSNTEGENPRLFAKGLRNAVFLKVNPQTGQLWGTEMGRDFLGDNLPPDEVNIIKEGKDYGWPLCYGNRVHDTDFDQKVYIQIVPQPPCGTTEAPIFEIPAHSAPLGLVFINSSKFPDDWQGDLLVSYHGSWNSSTPVGYKVVRMEVEGNKIAKEEDFITGFLPRGQGLLAGRQALGRPVDLEFDSKGSLFISDDKAGVVYKMIKDNE